MGNLDDGGKLRASRLFPVFRLVRTRRRRLPGKTVSLAVPFDSASLLPKPIVAIVVTRNRMREKTVVAAATANSRLANETGKKYQTARIISQIRKLFSGRFTMDARDRRLGISGVRTRLSRQCSPFLRAECVPLFAERFCVPAISIWNEAKPPPQVSTKLRILQKRSFNQLARS